MPMKRYTSQKASAKIALRSFSFLFDAACSATCARWQRQPKPAPQRGLRMLPRTGPADLREAGPEPLSRGGRPVCCVRMRPFEGFTGASLTGAAVEFLRRALV